MSTDNSQKPQTQAQVYRERQMESLRRTLGDDILGFLNDPAIIEIMLNQDGRIWVDVLGRDMEPRSAMDPVRAKMVIETVASMLDTSITKENPIISGELPLDGSRFEAQIPPIVEAPTFAIRKKALLVFTLDDYVAKGIMTERQRDIIIDAVRERKNILVSGGTGCHAKGTEIMMADGSLKNVEDVRVGDQVMGPDGSPRDVTRLHRGIDEMYRITPNKGMSFVVNGGHILVLREPTKGNVEVSVKDYSQTSNTFKHRHKLVYMEKACNFIAAGIPLPVDPYLVGIVLGDGYIGKSGIQIGKPDVEIYDAVKMAANDIGMSVSLYSHDVSNGMLKYGVVKRIGSHSGRSNRLLEVFRDLGLYGKKANEKFIPHIFKVASIDDRKNILAGLVDTDGTVDKKHRRYKITSKSVRLAEDIAFVARTLGFYVKVSRYTGQNTYTGKPATYYTTILSGGLLPTRVPRKRLSVPDSIRVNTRATGFVMEAIGPGAYYGFELSGDHLYIDGNFIVHHNSGKTTLLNAIIDVTSNVAPEHRIVMIQDTLEIQCNAPNVVSFRTSDEIDMTRLLKSTMRMRPDRIIVGEVRGKEALDLLKAWNTGHPGGIGTVHANDARAALVRIGMLVQEANVPPNPELIAEAVNIVVSIKRTSTGRIVDEVLAVKGFENGRFLTESL